MPIYDPTCNSLAAPGNVIANAVFELLVILHDVDDIGEGPEETAALEQVHARLVELTEVADSLAERLALELPPLPIMSPTSALAELLALVIESRRIWRAAEHGPESGVTMVEATPIADVVSQLEVRLARGGVARRRQ
jgi:hypothetical protein